MLELAILAAINQLRKCSVMHISLLRQCLDPPLGAYDFLSSEDRDSLFEGVHRPFQKGFHDVDASLNQTIRMVQVKLGWLR